MLFFAKRVLNSVIKRDVKLDSKIPFTHFIEDGILTTINEHFVSVLKIGGIDYKGLDKDKISQLYNSRNTLFSSLPQGVHITTHIVRELTFKDIKFDNSSSYVKRLEALWNKNFKYIFNTNHYIVISSCDIGGISDLGFVDNLKDTPYQRLEKLKENVKYIFKSLGEYSPYRLNSDEVLSFFASYVNGEDSNLKAPKGVIEELSSSVIEFPNTHNHMNYIANKKKHSSFIAIKLYENDFDDMKLIEDLLNVDFELSIYQQFSSISKQQTIKMLKDKINNVSNFNFSNVSLDDLENSLDYVENGDISFFKYSFIVQVKADSLKKLEINRTVIKNIIASYGYNPVIESTNIEALYFSNIPTLEYLNVRVRFKSNENISILNNFSSLSQGFNKNSWGDECIVKFFTDSKSAYRFNLHKDSSHTALANTLIIGGSGLGKTTLINFIISQSLKYENMKVLALDKFKGMKIFTDYMEGIYTDFDTNVNINPFKMKDTKANRTMLKTLISIMTSSYDNSKEEIIIDEAIDMMYKNLNQRERILFNIIDCFGSKINDDDIVSRLEGWLDGTSSMFLGKNDNLDFEGTKLNVFGMDSVLKDERATKLISLYIMYRFTSELQNSNSKGIIWIDELRNYIEDKHFSQKIKEIILEVRKLNCSFITAIQDSKILIDNKDVGSYLLGDSMANLILFPNSNMSKEAKEVLNLNSEEFNFIKTANPSNRQILFKRVGGEGIILNVDLEPLGKYLKIFDSSSVSVREFEKLKTISPNYKEEFLDR